MRLLLGCTMHPVKPFSAAFSQVPRRWVIAKILGTARPEACTLVAPHPEHANCLGRRQLLDPVKQFSIPIQLNRCSLYCRLGLSSAWMAMPVRRLPSGEGPPATIRPCPPRGSRRRPIYEQAGALVHLLIPPVTDYLYDAQAQVEYEAEAERDIVLL